MFGINLKGSGENITAEVHKVRGINLEFNLKYPAAVYKSFTGHIYNFSLKAGKQAALTARRGLKFSLRLAQNLSRKPLRLAKRKIDRMAVTIKRHHDILMHPAERLTYGIGLIRNNMSKAAELGYKSKLNALITTLRLGIYNNKKILFRSVCSFFNYALPIAAVTGFVLLVQYTAGLTYAIEITYNGESIGYVEEEAIFKSAEQKLKQRIIYVDGEEAIRNSVKFEMKIVDRSALQKDDQLVNAMLGTSEDDITEAYGLYINNEFYGATIYGEAIKNTLDRILEKYRQGNADAEVTFASKIEVKKGLYMTEGIMEPEKMVELLKSDVVGKKNYIIQDGDTPDGIARKHSMSLNELSRLNPNINGKYIFPGDELVISNSQPFLTVKVTREEEYTQRVAYKKVEINDTTQWKGYTKTVQKGQEGETKVRAKVSYTNGVKDSSTVISTTVLKNPVEERVIVGVKTPDSGTVLSTSSGSGSVSGIRFGWPVGGGYVSSSYGGRRNHKGLDIAAPRGTPVYAAAPGTVILSKTYSGYGRCIIIDHGNGVQTLYGHNSALYVKPGTKVERGQHIAAVGSTGWSTGNHLHFEIRSNGRYLSPGKYISK